MTARVQCVHRNSIPKLLKMANPHMDVFAYQKLEGVLAISDQVFVGLVDEEYACCWGLVRPSMMSDRAYLWLQTTKLVEEHKFLFVRLSQRWMQQILKEYSEIVGFCTPENKAAIRWIEWLGGEFRPTAFGRVDFVIRRKSPVEALCG